MEKGNEFLVNTKSICFMCFREKPTKIKIGKSSSQVNVSKNDGKVSISSQPIDTIPVVDAVKTEESRTNVERVNGLPTSAEGGPVNKAFCIRVLTRFLKVNLEKVFSLNVPFHSLHLLDKTELTVSLCAGCLPIANSFVTLCQELELLQMKIQGCVRRVHEVINASENDKPLVDNYRKLMVTPNPLDLIQAGIVDNLRKELLEKCVTRMQKAFPRVRLEKVKIASSDKLSSLTPNIDTPTLDLAAILTEENYLESIRRSASVIFTSSMKSLQDQSQAPKMQANLNLQLETVIAPPSDPNSVDDMEIFNDISEEIEIQSDPTPPSSSSPLNCENGLTDPLADSDFTLPLDEVLTLDKVSSPPTQHQQPEETENDTDDYVKLCKRIIKGQPRFYCELCNQRVTSKQKHKRVVHREGLLRCTYCGKGFSEYRERKLHTTIQHHFEKDLLPLMPTHMTQASFQEVTETCFEIITETKSRKDYSCPICNKSHRKTNNLRGHVVDKHFDTYKEKLYEILILNGHQPNIAAFKLSHPQTSNESTNLLEFKPSQEEDSGLDIITVVKPSVDLLGSDLNQSLTDLEYTMNSSQLESSISEEGSQSPALSQQPTQMDIDKDEEDDDGSDGKRGKGKYIVIQGRKADGRPLYYCNLCKKTVTNTIMHKRIHHGEKLLHCEHCNKEVTTAYILREHTAQFHPQQLFKSVKDDRCSDEQFSKFIDTLVADLIRKATDLKGPGDRQKCPLCLKECKQKGRWYIHMMEHHSQDLSEKVKQIQLDELGAIGLKEEKKVQQVILFQFQGQVHVEPAPTATPRHNNNSQAAIDTKVNIITPPSAAAVAVNSTVIQTPSSTPMLTPSTPSQKASSEKRSASQKTPVYSEKHRFTCDACGSRFTQSSSLKRHEKLYCKGVKTQEATTTEGNNEVEYHPLLAQSQTISPSQDSFSSSGQSITAEPADPIPTTSSIGEGLTTIDTSSLSWSFGSTSVGGNLGCSYCDKTFMFPYCQRTHLITAHRVETFSEHVPLGTSYEEVETVLNIILQDFNKTPNGMNSCNFCTKEYAQVTELESHVLISHFDEVVVKLKNLVQLREELMLNPNFGASFDNFNLLNEDCVIDGSDELVGENGEGDSGNVTDVQIFDLDQFPELREIYSSLSTGTAGGTGGDPVEAMVTGGDQDGMAAMGIEQVISAGNNNNDITLGGGDQLFY